MTYEVLLNNSPILNGHVANILIVVVLGILLLMILGKVLWRKLRENETLKYEFITIIAHKFRTPLTGVKWLIEGLLADETDARKKEEYTEVKNANDKLISLTGTLIELTNLDNETRSSYTFENVLLCDFVRNVANANRRIFQEKNISFIPQCNDNTLKANIDKQRLEFVLQTLLENARSYTPVGSTVELAVEREGHHAVILVADNGIGIAPADLQHIFTKFYRAKNAQEADTEGFGIGLYLAKSVIKRHHGKIEVNSAGLNKGTTFKVTLPAA